MATKQDYIDAINEKFDQRLSKASKSEKEKATVKGSGEGSGEQCVRSKQG